MQPPSTSAAPETWAPLRDHVYRSLWLAQLGSNIGTWMQAVGAQWMLVTHANAGTLVALVQTASLLPVMAFALPAGVLADVFDRRRLLLVAQSAMALTAAALTVLTKAGLTTPTTLLILTFLLGCGQALTGPAWQAIQPELVTPEQIPAAATLGSLTVNLARAVGPAVAGLIVATSGPAAVFGVNAVSFIGVLAALIRWHRDPAARVQRREPAVAALHAGARYVRNAPAVRRILLRLGLFVLPASALWALLPVVAHDRLGMGAAGYGGLLTALGVGSVLGAVVLGRLRAKLATNALLALSAVGFGIATFALAVTGGGVATAFVSVLMVVGGLAWILSLSVLNASIQLSLPPWVRARGLGVYLMVLMGGQAIGSFAWGLVAGAIGDSPALIIAAVLLGLCALSLAVVPLHARPPAIGGVRAQNPGWAEPALTFEPEPDDGPILVTVRYRVPPPNQRAFTTAMRHVATSRRRTGATSWSLYRDGDSEDGYTELFTVRSWDEHLRQHEDRLTDLDRAYKQAAEELADRKPDVAHFFPAS